MREPPLRLYTCPMAEHADVVSDKPGTCPKCEMDLVETTKVKHGPKPKKTGGGRTGETREPAGHVAPHQHELAEIAD